MHHDIHNKDSNVAKRASTRAQVGERFVSRSIDNKKARDFVLEVVVLAKGKQTQILQ
jgi:hypothetical protein